MVRTTIRAGLRKYTQGSFFAKPKTHRARRQFTEEAISWRESVPPGAPPAQRVHIGVPLSTCIGPRVSIRIVDAYLLNAIESILYCDVEEKVLFPLDRGCASRAAVRQDNEAGVNKSQAARAFNSETTAHT